MELWAAIDLMGGSAVTLIQGRAADSTVWKGNPLQLAERWENEGADGIHIIDLDAAFEKGSNEEAIEKIIEIVGVPVQVGGGVRTEERARDWLESGAARIIIGTMAYTKPRVLRSLLGAFGPDRVVVAADYKDGEIVTRGWKEGQGTAVEAAARAFEQMGVKHLLTTSVGRDGTGSGPDLEIVKILVRETRMGIIASGGIRDLKDLRSLEEAGAQGAIIGRALYEGTIMLSEARRSAT